MHNKWKWMGVLAIVTVIILSACSSNNGNGVGEGNGTNHVDNYSSGNENGANQNQTNTATNGNNHDQEDVSDEPVTLTLYNLDGQLAGDVSDFIDAQNIDFNRLEPSIVDNLDQFAEQFNTPGAVYGIPVSMNQGILAYNKDIFDRFGVAYPEDESTWDEIVDIGRQLTVTEEGVDYIGLDPGAVQQLTRARSLAVVDENGDAAIDTEDYQYVFNIIDQVYDIPGIVNEAEEQYRYGMNFFMEEHRLAMFPYWIAAFTSRIPIMEEAGLNWDITTYPTFDDQPGLGREIDYHLFLAPDTAEHREEALQFVSNLITDESQQYLSEIGRLTVLDDEDIRAAYASEAGHYDEKNLDGIFRISPSPTPESTPYDSDVYSHLVDAERRIALENVDVNTALRDANQEAQTTIEEIRHLRE